MAFIDSEGRLFGKINVIDAAVVGALVLAVFAFVVLRGSSSGGAQMVSETQRVEVDMLIRSLSIGDPKVFPVGKDTQVVIRNQPAGSLRIERVKVIPHLIPVVIGNQIKNIPDPSEPYGNDYVVTMSGNANVTADGLVIARIKAKIGTPIEIEGFKYVLRGGIIDVRTVGASPSSAEEPEGTPSSSAP